MNALEGTAPALKGHFCHLHIDGRRTVATFIQLWWGTKWTSVCSFHSCCWSLGFFTFLFFFVFLFLLFFLNNCLSLQHHVHSAKIQPENATLQTPCCIKHTWAYTPTHIILLLQPHLTLQACHSFSVVWGHFQLVAFCGPWVSSPGSAPAYPQWTLMDNVWFKRKNGEAFYRYQG